MTERSALINRFLLEEATPHIRALLKRSIAEAPGQGALVREFSFNVFDVAIDFDERRVTVADILVPDCSVTISLDAFVAALEECRL